MNVAADHTVSFLVARHLRQSFLVFGDKFHRRLGLEFQKRRERPVTETQRAPQPVEIKIKIENPVVKMRAEFFEQMIEMRQAIRLMAVDDEIFFPVGRRVDDLMRHHHAAKTHSGELVHKLVVVAGDVDDFRLLAALAEQFLDERVVIVAPEPAELQFPAVNEIADEVEVFAVHDAQKIQQFGDPRVSRAEMDVRNPDRPAEHRLIRPQIHYRLVILHNPMTIPLCGAVNNFGNKFLPLSPRLNLDVT